MRLITSPKTRLARRASALLVGLGLFLGARQAAASEPYPGYVQQIAGMPCVPQCTLCHSSSPGRLGTAVSGTLFAKTLISNGLGPLMSMEQVRDVLAKLVPAPLPSVDTDGDGTPDLNELREGTDPSAPGSESICGPTYGCGAHIAKAPPTSRAAPVLAALTVVGFAFAFRRAARRAR